MGIELATLSLLRLRDLCHVISKPCVYSSISNQREYVFSPRKTTNGQTGGIAKTTSVMEETRVSGNMKYEFGGKSYQ